MKAISRTSVILVIVATVLAGAAFFLGVQIGSTPQPFRMQIPPTKQVEPYELAISQPDLPPGFGIVDRSERRRIDVSADALELGWNKGYQIRFARIGGLLNSTSIEQQISFYPEERMNQVLQLSMRGFSVDEQLTIPNIGDRSVAFKKDNPSGRTYWIFFQKKNVHETLIISGSITDFELLKELARKAESKIP